MWRLIDQWATEASCLHTHDCHICIIINRSSHLDYTLITAIPDYAATPLTLSPYTHSGYFSFDLGKINCKKLMLFVCVCVCVCVCLPVCVLACIWHVTNDTTCPNLVYVCVCVCVCACVCGAHVHVCICWLCVSACIFQSVISRSGVLCILE